MRIKVLVVVPGAERAGAEKKYSDAFLVKTIGHRNEKRERHSEKHNKGKGRISLRGISEIDQDDD